MEGEEQQEEPRQRRAVKCQARTRQGRKCKQTARHFIGGQHTCLLHTHGYTRPRSQHPECATCFEQCRPRESTILECEHKFHTACLRMWFSQIRTVPSANTCPMCRATVSEEFISRILPGYRQILRAIEEDARAVNIYIPSLQRNIRLSSEMSSQQALVELVSGLDHHLLINYGVDIITDVLFRHHINRGTIPLIRPARVTFFGDSGPATPNVLAAQAEMQADGVEYGQWV